MDIATLEFELKIAKLELEIARAKMALMPAAKVPTPITSKAKPNHTRKATVKARANRPLSPEQIASLPTWCKADKSISGPSGGIKTTSRPRGYTSWKRGELEYMSTLRNLVNNICYIKPDGTIGRVVTEK